MINNALSGNMRNPFAFGSRVSSDGFVMIQAFRIYLSGNMNVPATGAAYTRIAFNVANVNEGGNFDTALYEWVAPSDGYLSVTGAIELQYGTPTISSLAIFKNGARQDGADNATSTGLNLNKTVSDNFDVTAGQIITVGIKHNAVGGAIIPTAPHTKFSGFFFYK